MCILFYRVVHPFTDSIYFAFLQAEHRGAKFACAVFACAVGGKVMSATLNTINVVVGVVHMADIIGLLQAISRISRN